MPWTELDRAAGTIEIGDANNSVYVATVAEAIEVALAWYPDAEAQPNAAVVDRLRRDCASARLLERLTDYLPEVWGADAPFLALVDD